MTSSSASGLVVKGAHQPYECGVRQTLQLKHRDNVNVVCVAVLGCRDGTGRSGWGRLLRFEHAEWTELVSQGHRFLKEVAGRERRNS